jgi:hypothetical protein
MRILKHIKIGKNRFFSVLHDTANLFQQSASKYLVITADVRVSDPDPAGHGPFCRFWTWNIFVGPGPLLDLMLASWEYPTDSTNNNVYQNILKTLFSTDFGSIDYIVCALYAIVDSRRRWVRIRQRSICFCRFDWPKKYSFMVENHPLPRNSHWVSRNRPRPIYLFFHFPLPNFEREE